MNFLVWRQGLRGPIASIDLFDPRQSGEWKVLEQTTLEIIPLKEHEQSMSLDTLVALHPCKETA